MGSIALTITALTIYKTTETVAPTPTDEDIKEPTAHRIDNSIISTNNVIVTSLPTSTSQQEANPNTISKDYDSRTLFEVDPDTVPNILKPVYEQSHLMYNLLNHINLMKGNTLTDEELLKASNNEDHELHEYIKQRVMVGMINPDEYRAMIKFEVEVTGVLTPPDQLEATLDSALFEEYKEYLLQDRIVVPFCEISEYKNCVD